MKMLDTWLCQEILRPSKSPYASQVVIVHKKLGEIHIGIDYHKLNSITVRDAFLLPRIDEALKAVYSSNWFSSFDLQLAMEEDDMKRQLLEPDLQASMSLLACLLVYQMQTLAPVISWSNV